MVTFLANYNFDLKHRSGKENVDVDALSHILWEDHDQHVEVDTVWALISNVTQGTTLIEDYSCNIQGTEALDMQKIQKPCCRKIGS